MKQGCCGWQDCLSRHALLCLYAGFPRTLSGALSRTRGKGLRVEAEVRVEAGDSHLDSEWRPVAVELYLAVALLSRTLGFSTKACITARFVFPIAALPFFETVQLYPVLSIGTNIADIRSRHEAPGNPCCCCRCSIRTVSRWRPSGASARASYAPMLRKPVCCSRATSKSACGRRPAPLATRGAAGTTQGTQGVSVSARLNREWAENQATFLAKMRLAAKEGGISPTGTPSRNSGGRAWH